MLSIKMDSSSKLQIKHRKDIYVCQYDIVNGIVRNFREGIPYEASIPDSSIKRLNKRLSINSAINALKLERLSCYAQ